MHSPNEAYIEALLTKLAPETVRTGLVRAGLFLAGWELLKKDIEDQVLWFFAEHIDSNGPRPSEKYKQRVLSRHKKRFEASLLWLVDAKALTEAQAEQARALRDHRNEVAHELPRFLTTPGSDVSRPLLDQMRELITTLGRFWGRIEVDVSGDFDGVDVADDEIRSGTMMLMDFLIDASQDAKGSAP